MDLTELEKVEAAIKDFVVAKEEAGKSWYKVDHTDIPIIADGEGGKVLPLSTLSPIIGSLKATRRVSLYSRPEQAKEARSKVAELTRGMS